MADIDKNTNKHTEKGTMGFKKGNPGRPKGSVSKSVLTARRLMTDYSDHLMREGIKVAMDGDVQMLRFFCNKLIGKLDAGIKPKGDSPADMLRSILRQINKNGVSADDAAGQVEIIKALTTAIELEDVQKRLTALEDAK